MNDVFLPSDHLQLKLSMFFFDTYTAEISVASDITKYIPDEVVDRMKHNYIIIYYLSINSAETKPVEEFDRIGLTRG